MLPMKLFATRVHPSRVNASQVQIKYLLTGNGNKMKPERVSPTMNELHGASEHSLATD